jgi:hypothetical protein
MRKVIADAAVAIAVSGCASYSWYRPNTPAAVAAQDESDCLALARGSAYDIAVSAMPLAAFPHLYGPRFYGPGWGWPYTGWGPWDPYWGPAGDPLWRTEVEQRIYNRCMQTRGYELQRVEREAKE